MVSSKQGTGPVSPWEFYNSGGDYQGNGIVGTVTFSGTWNGSNTLTGGSVTRDAGCVWTKIIIGDPTNPTRTINVGNLVGTRNFSAVQLAAVGFNTVADIIGLNVTASA